MLTGKEDEEIIITALKAGAKGYLSKNATCENLIKSIKVVHDGDLWVERRLITRILEEYSIASSDAVPTEHHELHDLTPREQEVLCCLAKGGSNKEIARSLSISEKTVKSHLNNIFKKLHVSRRLDAILYAIRNGLS